MLAVGCNLVNNLPAGLVAGRVIELAHVPEHVRSAVLIGVDLGPNLSVTGSLATILLLTALRREGQSVSAWAFLKLGALVMPPALLLAIAGAFASAEPGKESTELQNISSAWLYPLILTTGALQAWGPPMNGALGKSLGNPWLASLISLTTKVPTVFCIQMRRLTWRSLPGRLLFGTTSGFMVFALLLVVVPIRRCFGFVAPSRVLDHLRTATLVYPDLVELAKIPLNLMVLHARPACSHSA